MKKAPLPSGMTKAQLREAAESAIAAGQLITVNAPDLLALLVSLDLRERLDPDVELVARFSQEQIEGDDPNSFNDHAVVTAAQRVLAHEPKPDLSGVPS